MNDVGAHLTGGYEAFNRGDFGHLEKMMVPEFVWNEADEVPGRKLCLSRDEFAEYMRGFPRLWESFAWEPISFQEAGDAVIAKVRGHGVGRASGAPVELVIHHVWQFRPDGLITRMDAFLDEREALEHAGLD